MSVDAEQLVRRLASRGVDAAQWQPCSPQQVQALEAHVGGQLPAAYRAFLLLMGRGAGDYLAGTPCFYDELLPIQAWSRSLLAQHRLDHLLPPDAFFFVNNGYHLLFFRLCEGDDPPVYTYLEGDAVAAAFPRAFERYSDFLLSMADE